MTTAAEVGRKMCDMTEPSRGQENEVGAEGAATGAMMSAPNRCCDCGIRITTGLNSITDGDEYRKPMPIQVCPVGREEALLNDTGRKQYRLNSQAPVGGTDIPRARSYLEGPVVRMPGVFLKLAEEARNSELVDDQSTDMKDVQPQRTGRTRPVLITEIFTSTPVFGSRASRVINTSTEVIPDINRDKPVNRSGPVGQLSDTEQPIMLGVMTDKGTNGPNGPVGHDVMLAGRMKMVNRPDPVGPYSGTEQSVFLRLDADQGEHIPTNRVHPGVKMFRTQPVADGPAGPDRARRPVGTDHMYTVHDEVQPTAGGPVGRFPDPGPPGEVQIDRVNISMANGQTDSTVTPPSSDSGVHSLGEQWESMSTNSMDTGSIQTVKTFYGGDTSQVDRKSPQENRKVVFSDESVFGKKDSMVYSNTDSHNSDIAAMSDFSNDEDWSQGELQPSILTVSDDSIKKELNSCDELVPDITTAGVGSISLDSNDKDYWTNFRLLTRQAFLLDNDKLAESDYPDAVKEVVTRSRLTILDFNERKDTSDDSDKESTTSIYDEFRHRLEDYCDWHYDTAPIVPDIAADDDIRTVRNAENNDGQCLAFRKGNEDKHDLHSEPDGRAKLEVSPEKAVRSIDTFSLDYVRNDDITVNMRDSAGISDTKENEIMRVSMITADIAQENANSDGNNSLGIQDCVFPAREKQHDLSAHMDFVLCEKDSIRNVTITCFGVCGLTHRMNRPELDWCWGCVDMLMWGYRVSCVVSIVTKNRSVGLVYSLKAVVYTPVHGV